MSCSLLLWNTCDLRKKPPAPSAASQLPKTSCKLDMFLERFPSTVLILKAILCFVLERAKILPYIHVEGHSRSRDFGPRYISTSGFLELPVRNMKLDDRHVPHGSMVGIFQSVLQEVVRCRTKFGLK